MGRLWLPRGWTMACTGLVACGLAMPSGAADLAGFSPGYSGAQVMLYLSYSFSGHNQRAQAFGFRYERSSPASNDPGARFCAPLAHRSLVDLQFARGAGPRMQFGPRVTWDISRGRIAPTNQLNSWLVSPRLTAPTPWGAAAR